MKVAFLDRDGVINYEKKYVHQISDFEFINGSIEALRNIVSLDFSIIIVTNQSGIGRGYYSLEQYESLTKWYLTQLRERGVGILDVLHCPHVPIGGQGISRTLCNCRKPKPGLIERACRQYPINLNKSFMVGDKVSDVLCAKNAGLERSALVRSGHLLDEEDIKVRNVPIFDHLFQFSEALRNGLWLK